MNAQSSNLYYNSRRFYEFCFPKLDTLVQVQELDDEVVIRATRDTFTERRKVCFIRELAAEGFISEAYQWFSGFGGWSSLPVRWLVDYSWLKSGKNVCARTNRFMIRSIFGAILLWLGMMFALFLGAR